MTKRVFNSRDWDAWFDRMARSIFNMSGAEFEAAYSNGEISHAGVAEDLGSMIPLITKIRALPSQGPHTKE